MVTQLLLTVALVDYWGRNALFLLGTTVGCYRRFSDRKRSCVPTLLSLISRSGHLLAAEHEGLQVGVSDVDAPSLSLHPQTVLSPNPSVDSPLWFPDSLGSIPNRKNAF